MKREILLMLLITTMLALTGCATQPPGYYEALTKAVNLSVDSNQVAITKVLEAVKKANVIPDAKLDSIAEAVTIATDAIDLIQIASLEAAKEYDAKATEDKLGALIDAAIVLNAKSAPINPYAAVIGGVLTLGSAGYAALTKKSKNIVDKKYKSHVQGVQEVSRNADPRVADDLYNAIGKARVANKV
jgi:predicted small lipoprotein YifL